MSDEDRHIQCGIAFGSNVGDRLANLSAAKVLLLQQPEIVASAAAFSAVYECSAVGCEEGTPPFLNAVGEVAFAGTARALLAICQRIEGKLGRPERRSKNSPRTLDLDVLYVGDVEMDSETLALPHPRLGERRFVLEPLASIRPNLVISKDGCTVSDQLASLQASEPPLQLIAEDW